MAGGAGRTSARTSERTSSNSRGERTRRRIAEATLSLLIECDAPPTGQEIAERAGVSHRLIFHHYEDLDALHVMVASLFVDRFGKLVPVVPSDLPLEARIERTTNLRASLYEAVGNLGHNAAALAPSHPSVAQGTVATQRILIDFLEQTFAPELTRAGRPGTTGRKELLAMLDAAASWPTWDRLRRVDGLSVASSRRVTARMLRAALWEAG